MKLSIRILAKILKDPMRIFQRSLKNPYGNLQKREGGREGRKEGTNKELHVHESSL